MSDIRPDIWRLQAKSDIQGLIAALSDEDAAIRKRAAAALRAIGSTEAIPHLRSLLAVERSPDTRETIVSALAVLEPDQDTAEVEVMDEDRDSLLNHLIATLNDPDPEQIVSAARVLAEMRNKRAAEPLVVVFNDKSQSEYVRLAVAEALLALESAPVEVALLKALRSDKWRVRRNGAAILGQVGATWAVEPLANALKDENEVVRRTALAALKRLDTPEARVILDKLRTREFPQVDDRTSRRSLPGTRPIGGRTGSTQPLNQPESAAPATRPLQSPTPTAPTPPPAPTGVSEKTQPRPLGGLLSALPKSPADLEKTQSNRDTRLRPPSSPTPSSPLSPTTGLSKTSTSTSTNPTVASGDSTASPASSTVAPTQPVVPNEVDAAAREARRRAVEDTQISGKRPMPSDDTLHIRPPTLDRTSGDDEGETDSDKLAWPKRDEVPPKSLMPTKPLDPRRLEEAERRQAAQNARKDDQDS